jgi:hypothetical protein
LSSPTFSGMVGAMGFQYLMLVQLTWVGVLLISGMAAAGVAAQLALPNCPEPHCGGVEIPYPFGITDGCYLNQDFALTCNHSSGQIQIGNVIVTNISIQGQIDILMYVAHQCFNESGILKNKIQSFSVSALLSQFLTPKTCSWPLAVTLMRTFILARRMTPSPWAAYPDVQKFPMWSMGLALGLGVAR